MQHVKPEEVESVQWQGKQENSFYQSAIEFKCRSEQHFWTYQFDINECIKNNQFTCTYRIHPWISISWIQPNKLVYFIWLHNNRLNVVIWFNMNLFRRSYGFKNMFFSVEQLSTWNRYTIENMTELPFLHWCVTHQNQ